VYANSLAVPFLLDDSAAIEANLTLRHLGHALSPPANAPESGRPLLNLSFAANYAIGGLGVRGYHALNLAVHLAAALVLFGVVRRTLVKPALRGRFAGDAWLLALLTSLLWALHPVQTEAVTYVSQRAESLMGLLYLLSLYFFIVGGDSARPAPWHAASVLALLLGAMTKEVIATAPLVILLYDRTFCAGSFAGALRARWRFYLATTLSWALLLWLAVGEGKRGVGFGYGIGPFAYALTSLRSVATYLRLSVVPFPLVFDYGMDFVRRPLDVWPEALAVGAAAAFGVVALFRSPAVGFAVAWFFLILAPTSSVIPLARQPMAEHRMYLPLAGLACLGVLSLYRLLGRRGLATVAVVAVAFGYLSHLRNADYRDEAYLWRDTLTRRPNNARAHVAYGFALSREPGGLPKAVSEYEAAIRIDPGYVEAHNKLGIALAQIPGRALDAVGEFRQAIRLNPGYVEAHESLGVTLAGIPGRLDEAVSEYEAALRIDPGYVPALIDLGLADTRMPGRTAEAIGHFEDALRIDPGSPRALDGLGVALAQDPGRLPEAVAAYRRALGTAPDDAEIHFNLGTALSAGAGNMDEAIYEFRTALRLKPDFADAHNGLGSALAALSGRRREAIAEYEAALRGRPDYPEALNNLGLALAQEPGRLGEAVLRLEAAVRLKPDYVEALDNLGLALSRTPGRETEAIPRFEAALRLSPSNARLHNDLGIALAAAPGRPPDAIGAFQEALRLKPDYPDARRNLEVARQMLAQTRGN
jgi:tetratricopeptide (TPR) repeat protein